jgi:hypothetical protein
MDKPMLTAIGRAGPLGLALAMLFLSSGAGADVQQQLSTQSPPGSPAP